MKKRRLFSTLAAALVTASMLAALPMNAGAAATQYEGLIGTDGSDAWLTNTVTDSSNTEIKSYNATEFKKVLEIEDTANIPACEFSYTVTTPDSNVSATYNDDKTIKTLAVFQGVGADKIAYNLENVNLNKFVTDSNTDYNEKGLSALDNGNGTKLSYTAQTINLPANGNTKSVEDNVLINNVSGDTYYAIKTIQMDFTNCGFTEPGIYRYYIQETGDNQGITNDSGVTDITANCWRTIDVYVEDATYIPTNTAKAVNKLKIAGYVMYVGKQKAGPAAGEAANLNPAENTMEDGLAHTNPSGNGGANGVEVADAVKSEGIKNTYSTSDITFEKTVDGNQASKDKFFKFHIKLTDDTTTGNNATIKNVADTDKFIISKSSTQVVEANWNDDSNKPNAATPYTKGTIYTANAANEYKENGNDLTYRYVTGKQLKDGYNFYLQDSQFVTIQGLPNGIGYEMTEWQDDYTPTVSLKTTENNKTYDNKNGDDTNGTLINAPEIINVSNVVDDPENTAKIVDTKITNDVYATFTNTRKGVIPTGILISVAPAAIVGICVIGGIVFLIAKNKRRESEED